MPAWLLSAFNILRSGRFLAGTAAGAAPALVGIGESLAFPGGGFLGLGGEGRPRRRRRRRALTASDRADIAFISGTLGAKAGKDFAVTLVAGLTR